MSTTLDALLGAATKKTAKSSHLIYDKLDCEVATNKLLSLKRKMDEEEREVDFLRENIRSAVEPWHDAECARRREHEPTVEIKAANGTLRVSFQHRYGKIPLSKHPQLTQAVNGDFDRFFKKAVSLKVKKDISDDPEKLTEVVMKIANAMGNDMFAQVFEVEQTWAPTKVFTETSCQLSQETRAALVDAGVKQVVAMAEKK